MNDKIWQNAAQASVNSGVIPIPVTGTLIELFRIIMSEKEAEFITIFTKPLNLDEIKEKSNLDDKSLDEMLNNLMRNGIITGIASKSTGVVVYRLLAPIPGIRITTFFLLFPASHALIFKLSPLFRLICETLNVSITVIEG